MAWRPAERECQTLLVIDAGAGTTDATILRVERGDLRVLAHVGLPVGGMDLDTFIAALKGPLRAAGRAEVMQRLETARQAKQHHLGGRDAGFEELARDLVHNNAWPGLSGTPGRSVARQ